MYRSGLSQGNLEAKSICDIYSSYYPTLTDYQDIKEKCLRIKENPDAAYNCTLKGNLVGIISNGTNVSELGNIGALASKPAMEGKARLLKKYADIDAFDIELNSSDIDVFVRTVITISPTFGAIILEDIKAPECFEIERRLIEALDIPVMHDDQDGTAIVSAAGLLNACEIAGKVISEIKLVINGAGAAALACAEMYLSLGLKKENLIMLDSKGVISQDRIDLDKFKKPFAANTPITSLEEALIGADAFVGLSKGNILTPAMLHSMSGSPIIFALANPTPEINYTEAIQARPDILYASGRSDLPNQIDNMLGFPYIFRAALDVRAHTINSEMKKAAVFALASIAKETECQEDGQNTIYGRSYFIPRLNNKRLMLAIALPVSEAAISSGIAGITIADWDVFGNELKQRTGI